MPPNSKQPPGIQPVDFLGPIATGSPAPAAIPASPTNAELPASTALKAMESLIASATDPAKRRTDLEEAKASVLGLQRQTASIGTLNQRRSWLTAKFFAATMLVMLALLGAFGTMLYSFYQKNIQPSLALINQRGSVYHELESSSELTVLKSELSTAKSALTKANDALNRLQHEYDALSLKQQTTDSSIAKLVESMQQAITRPTSDGKTTDGTRTLADALQVASVVPIATPVNQELWLLKERNRLTFYADEAIALGSSEAMQNLWRSLTDPELAKLHDGAKAEIIRVQNYYSQLSRLPPDYRLPVQELFKDPTIRNEADVPVDKLIEVLLNQKLPIEMRARAAYVLGGHPKDTNIAKALLQAMTTDPSLDVMKEAQRTLSEDHGMHIPPLHAQAATEWWKAQTEKK